MRVYLFVCFFPRGDRIDPVVLEACERAHSNGNETDVFRGILWLEGGVEKRVIC